MALWRRLPVIVRAVILGGVVTTAGHAVPGAFYLANFEFWPQIPWSTVYIIVYLWFFWHYLSGRWWPRSTAETRKQYLRGGALSSPVWRWALIAGGLWMSAEAALHFALAHLETIRYEGFYRLFAMDIPPWTLAVVLLAASAVAGIVEEAAFRGYMQTPIERRHGVALAISIPGIMFVLAHFTDLNVPMSITRIFLILSASVAYGLLTHLSGSIRPGIVLHATGDAVGIGMLWAFWSLSGPPSHRAAGLAAASRNPLFWLYCAETVLFTAAAVGAFLKLAQVARSQTAVAAGARRRRAADLCTNHSTFHAR